MRFKIARTHIIAGEYISEGAQLEIQKIIDNLSTASTFPNKLKETEIIRSVCQRGEMKKVKLTYVDIYLENHNGEIFLFDLKTTKPNVGGFKEFKRTMLEWIAVVLAKNPNSTVHSIIAIPYNPYAPQPYNRWTMRGMIDLNHELKVAEEFWDFLGGNGAYQDLLDCFEKVGIAMRSEIDDYFKRFSNS